MKDSELNDKKSMLPSGKSDIFEVQLGLGTSFLIFLEAEENGGIYLGSGEMR
jgi:hypothetical protein